MTKTFYVVTFINKVISVVEFTSGDGEHFQASTDDSTRVVEPRRIVKDDIVHAANGKLGCIDNWLVCEGVHEFWAESPDVAQAVAKTFQLAHKICSDSAGGCNCNNNDGWGRQSGPPLPTRPGSM